MSLLGDEKASERRFKITGKYSGGVGSSGRWTPASQTEMGGNRFGNDWEAEARYWKNDAPQPTMKQRLKKGLGTKQKYPGAASTDVKIPGKNNTIKSKTVAAAKEAVRNKAKSILSPRAQSEATRLENLFTK